MADDRWSPGSSGILSLALVPLKESAFPYLPLDVQVAFAIVPFRLLPD
jgi:hypothetical protein